MNALAKPKMKVNAAVPWYGSNRSNAALPGKLAGKLDWLGVPCVGSACELPHFNARTIMAADVHRHLINYLNVLADPALNRELRKRVRRLPFAEETLRNAQARCIARQVAQAASDTLFAVPSSRSAPFIADVDWAVDYFVCCWMGRSAKAGTEDEFCGGLPVRWNAGGGDSVVRYKSAWRTLRAWTRATTGTQFLVMDFFAFIERALEADAAEGEKRADGKKPENRCLYVDLPWPVKGKPYLHKFSDAMQRVAAGKLAQFKYTSVIVRFGDHTLIRELYPSQDDGGPWHWQYVKGRNQDNDDVDEVLILNGPAFAALK